MFLMHPFFNLMIIILFLQLIILLQLMILILLPFWEDQLESLNNLLIFKIITVGLVIHLSGCQNLIFTPGIFLDIGTQNETAWTKPAWSDESSPRQITSKRGLGHISWNLTKFSQGWPSLTKVDQVWPRFDQAVSDPTGGPPYPKKPPRCGLGYISQNPKNFDQVWPRFDQAVPDPTRVHHTQKTPKMWFGIHFPEFGELWPSLTKFDRGLTGPLTKPKAGLNWPPPDQCMEHVESFDSILYGSKTDEKRESYRQNCEKRSNT